MKVSVCCITYNQKKYIKDALEGFVNQVTDFEYEVLVHDDASNDGTTEIIAEYVKKYPNLIKPIYQTENQYSKGVDLFKTNVWPNASGEYIAICEGDDFWCDVNKLQKQVDFLETHPEYSACVHNTRGVFCRKSNKTKILYQNKADRDIALEEVLEKGGKYFHTSSIMFRAKYKDLPSEFQAKGFGDYPLAIYLALQGKIYYFKDVMSVYRVLADGSITSREHFTENKQTLIDGQLECVRLLQRIDQYTNYEHHQGILYGIRLHQYYIEGVKGNFKVQFHEYKDVVKRQKFSVRMKLYIKCIIPNVVIIKEKLQKITNRK